MERLASLHPGARDLATVLAVAGKPLATSRRVGSRPGRGARRRRPRRRRARRCPRRCRPLRHALVGEAVERTLADNERRRVHGRLAAALAAAEPGAQERSPGTGWAPASTSWPPGRTRPIPASTHRPSERRTGRAADKRRDTAPARLRALAIAAAQADDLGQASRVGRDRRPGLSLQRRPSSRRQSGRANPSLAVAALRQSVSSPGSFLELSARSRRRCTPEAQRSLSAGPSDADESGRTLHADPRRQCAVALIEAGDIAPPRRCSTAATSGPASGDSTTRSRCRGHDERG